MDDLISRAAVIKAVDRHTFDTDNGLCLDDDITVILEEVPSAQPTQTNTSKALETLDCVSRLAAIDAVHKSIIDFFDICDDDKESPMTYKDEQLLEINKAITTRVKALPSAQSNIAMDIATIIENEKDMRVLLNAQPRMKGEWIDNETSYADGVRQSCNCSVCGKRSIRPLGDFCRWCGADMRGEQDV